MKQSNISDQVQPPKVLTADEVADVLRVHRKTVRGFIRRGLLHPIKASRRVLVASSELDRFIAETSK